MEFEYNAFPLNFILIFYLFIGSFTFLLFRYDKYLAKQQKQRISEKSLLIFSALGGAWGAILGMYIGTNHKTKKMKFVLLVPIALILHILFLIYYWYKI